MDNSVPTLRRTKTSPIPSKPRKPLPIRALEFPDVSTPDAAAAATVGNGASGPDQNKPGPEDVTEWRKLLDERIKKLARFGPTYGEDTDAITKVKDSAWGHITAEHGAESRYIKVIKEIEKEVVECYDDTRFSKKLKRGVEFRRRMARDGCFFLQLSLHILGGGAHLGYPEQNPYFGENIDSTSWIPDMFFVGNQIPYIVIKALMEQPFFQGIIEEGIEKKTWKRPPADDLANLALYLTVVEPHLEKEEQKKKKKKKKKPDSSEEASSDILQTLHNLILKSGSDINDPTYHEMKEFQDLEANNEGKDVKIPSSGELYKLGIKLVKGEAGIPSIRFQNWGYSAFLYVPPLTINAYTEVLLTSLANHELALRESEREVTAYLRFMRDLCPTYKDFKILEREGIIVVEDQGLKGTTLRMLDAIVSRHNSNFTLTFWQIRRQITDYGGPPWRLISFCLGVLAVVQTIFSVLSYCIPPNT